MASPLQLPVEDKDLDDAALWAVIDSAAAAAAASPASLTSRSRRQPLSLKHSNFSSPPQALNLYSPPPPQPVAAPSKVLRTPTCSFQRHDYLVHDDDSDCRRPRKLSRSSNSEVSEITPLAVVKHAHQRSPVTPVYYTSPQFTVKEASPYSEVEKRTPRVEDSKENSCWSHSLSGRFPTVSLFKEYQNAAMAILEKSDYTMVSGNPFIKKSGWRKIAFYFNLSFEIKDRHIEFDENRNVQRAEFVVRAYMQGGRFSDGWGSCERREKRFSKPNHDIPSTAETRAKNRACQDLLGIGEYRPGVSNNHHPR